ncbi:helix-turn-helix domain-containing protein [Spirosoma rigui]|uniref:hypothetical protein n=1 Tax=Spirosoma rigui TaxID=564064 RepID=UPI0009B0B4D6|nr:hypothetical protein [Spirosoma rigui]
MIEFDYTKVICQRSSLQRLHEQTQLLNEAMPSKTFVKLVNGEERLYERKPKAITGSVEATMERLIKNYVKYHHRLLRNVGQEAFEEGMPGMLTCRSEVAGQRTISEKTAYNHLRKLRELGLIKRYKFRGSRHAFEIWIAPELLFQPERLDQSCPQPAVNNQKSADSQPQKIASFLALPANFTAYKVTVTSKNFETEKEKGGNVHSDALQQEHGDKNYGNPERQQPKLGKTLTVGSESHSDLGTGGARPASRRMWITLATITRPGWSGLRPANAGRTGHSTVVPSSAGPF